MSSVLIEIVVILLLTVINGVFALSEIAIVSGRKMRLQHLAGRGNARAKAALQLAIEPAEFLSTVQIGITLIGVLAGAFGGATLAEQLAAAIGGVPLLSEYAESIAIAVVVIGITYLSLVIGELVPKRIALNNPERIAVAVAPPMKSLARLMAPAVTILSLSTNAVLRLLRSTPPAEPPITEEEIRLLIEQGTRTGVFERAEREMLENVFRLANRKVSLLMTPRAEVVSLDLADSSQAIRSKLEQSGHSRFPVCDGSEENVVGVVFSRDMLLQVLAAPPISLRGVMRTPLYIPEGTTALKAMEMFKRSGIHIAIVVDEHGSPQGVLTMNDILEAIGGAVSSADQPRAIRRSDGSWLVDGMMAIEDVESMLGITGLQGTRRAQYETLAGFALASLGHIPGAGERFTVNQIGFEIVDMDGFRIDKILVMPPLPRAGG
jgi:putative hemolysin